MKTQNLFSLLVTFLVSCPLLLSAQDVSGPQAPPVDVEFKLLNTTNAGEDGEVMLKVTPGDNVVLDIKVLLPEKNMVFNLQPALMISPFDKNMMPFKQTIQGEYKEVINCFTGAVKSGQAKEYRFHVKINEKAKYELKARIVPLAKWFVPIEPVLEIGGNNEIQQ